MTYNDHGDVIAEVTREVDEGGAATGGAGRHISASETRYSHDYDSLHNWVRRVAEAREEDGEFRTCLIEGRDLKYYGTFA